MVSVLPLRHGISADRHGFSDIPIRTFLPFPLFILFLFYSIYLNIF